MDNHDDLFALLSQRVDGGAPSPVISMNDIAALSAAIALPAMENSACGKSTCQVYFDQPASSGCL